MTKLAPEWVRTSDPVIRSPARYRWTTVPAYSEVWNVAQSPPTPHHVALVSILAAERHRGSYTSTEQGHKRGYGRPSQC